MNHDRCRCGLLALVLGPSLASAQAPAFVEPHRMLPDDLNSTMEFAIGDFDADGDLDLVAASYAVCRLYRNRGDARFEFDLDALPAPDMSADAVAAADVDGDGDLDLLFTYQPTGNLLYLNDGLGKFTDATDQLPAGLTGGEAVVFGDADRDGDLDAFVGRDGADLLLVNDATGHFIDGSARLPGLNVMTTSAGFDDLDQDGDLDLVIGSFGGSGPVGFVLRSDGVNFASEPLPPSSTQVRDLALGDVDQDGDTDVLLVGFQDIELHLNTGAGSFVDATAQMPNLFGSPTSVVLVDLTGNGALDIWAVTPGVDWYFRNDGTGHFTNAGGLVPPSSGSISGVDAADLDGDGDTDLIGSAEYGANRLLLNDGAGQFLDATVLGQADGSGSTCAALGDVDGDGDLDGVYGSGGGRNQLFLNDGTGAMLNVTTTHMPTDYHDSRSVALGDVDGDGDLDLVVGNFPTSNDPRPYESLYLNDGSGHFVDESARLGSPAYDTTTEMLLADLDADLDLDLFVINGFDTSRMLLNDGAGFFSNATGQIPGDVYGSDAALADLDGDGHLDVFVSDGYGSSSGKWPNRLLLNDGSAHFADASAQLPPDVQRSACVALADVDADGDVDAFVGNLDGADPGDRLYLNDGNAHFTDASNQLPVYAHNTRICAFIDFDRDGDHDLLIDGWTIPSGGRHERLFLNDGLGTFTEATNLLMLVSSSSRHFAVGDADSDGDLDYLTAGGSFATERLMRNTHHHLAWVAVPRLGRPLEMEVRGRPGGAFVLVASRASVAPFVGPCGVVRIDRERIALTRPGVLDADGAAIVTFGVSADPALAGVTLHWQAFLRPAPCGWTNLERTTFEVH